MIHHGDCLEVMAGFAPESVDAIVTDPPYGLEFMGKAWDKLDGAGFHAPKDEGRTFTNASGHMYDNLKALPRYGSASKAQAFHARWAEAAYRVAKPSAYLLAFGGTRTVHRLTTAIEDAGWIIRDMLVWAYASGFPKSKANLKPAWEPVVMARKPGPLRMLAIDECRIPTDGERIGGGASGTSGFAQGYERGDGFAESGLGRWPANVILTDPIFDGGWDGVVGGGEAAGGTNISTRRSHVPGAVFAGSVEYEETGYGDSGTYSRFFILPKADRADREPVMGGLPQRELVTHGQRDQGPLPQQTPQGPIRRANHHPTVKPVDLMRHLVRLVTPTGGTVLDPFLGSGTTAIAAEMEGFDWIGIEKEREYCDIAEARLNGTQRGLGLPA